MKLYETYFAIEQLWEKVEDNQSDQTPRVCSLPELCAECACILGKSVTEVAATLSLPEALLLIRQDNRRQMEQLRYHTQSRALANAAIWSRPALRALERFEKSLKNNRQHNPTSSNSTLANQYRQAGVTVKSTLRKK